MNLRDLLSELRANILRDTSTAVVSPNDDALWTDDALVRYIRDAEEKFAAGTLCLRDATTSPLTRITLVAGQADYALDRRVLAVYAAQHSATHLGKSSFGSRFGARADLTPASAWLEPGDLGAPQQYYTDRETAKIGFYPVPSAAEAGSVVVLQVARRPLVPLSLSDLDAEPEIPEEYHLDLLEWAAWRALRNHDADVDGEPGNLGIVMARTSAHKKRFEDAVAECKRRMKYLNTQHVAFGVQSNWS